MNLKKCLPYCLSIIAFLLITYFSFKPSFEGKIIYQSDIIQHQGMSKELLDFREKENKEALWTNSAFGGMPAYQVSTKYSGNMISHIDRFIHLYLPRQGGFIFMCFLGFFILLLCLEINPWLSFAGALAYGFSSFFFIIIEVGHNSQANAISYLAPVLGGLILLMRQKYWLGFAVCVLFITLELNSNHPQVTYYGFILFTLIIMAYLIKAIKDKNVKPVLIGLGLFILSSGIAFLPNAGSLLATYEYGKYSTRGQTELTIGADLQSNKENKTSGLDKSYALQYSHGIWETLTFLIPNFKGGKTSAIGNTDKDALNVVDPEMREYIANGDAYFGDQGGTSGPVYIGAIVIFLSFLGLFILDHILKWPLLVATVLCMMLSWGRFFPGLSNFFFDFIPGYDKFRSVSMILIIAELTLPLMAILTVDKVIKVLGKKELFKILFINKPIDIKKAILISFIAVGGFCLISYLMPQTINTFSPPNEKTNLIQQFKNSGASEEQIAQFLPLYIENLQKARIVIFKSDALRSFIYILLAVLILYLFVFNKIKKPILFVGLGLLFIADMWPIAARYLNSSNFISKEQEESAFTPTRADEQILQDKSLDYRVLNLSVNPFMDATTSYHHKSIGGYHGAKMKKYDELISFHLFREMDAFSRGIAKVRDDSAMNILMKRLPVLNMLNTKYIIYPGKEAPVAIPNQQADGNVWFIQNLKTVENADSEIVGLYNLNTKTEAIIQQKNKQGLNLLEKYPGEGNIILKSYKPNELIYETEVKSKEFAVFSEIYYPKGWNAYIDGKLTNHICVNYILRGMEIQPGKHTINFMFEPKIYKTGNNISLIGSIIVIITTIGSFLFSYKRKEFSI